MKEKTPISVRLRQFGEQHYGSMAAFGRALGLRPQELYRYLSGQIQPGNKLQAKLRELGCDLEWLMTGQKAVHVLPYQQMSVSEPLIEFNAPGGVPPEEKKKMQKLARKLSKLNGEEMDKIDKLLDLFLEGKTKPKKR